MATVIVPAGRQWLLVDRENWPKMRNDYKARGLLTWQEKKTAGNPATNEAFIVAEFKSPTTLPMSVVKRFGPVLTKDDEDPVIRGVWGSDPSWEHYAYETSDAVSDALRDAGEAALKGASTLTGVLWAGAALAGVVLLLRFKK